MIDQVEVERFKLQILTKIQEEDLTDGTAVIEIPAGSESIALAATVELESILQHRNVKTILVSQTAATVISAAFVLLSDSHAAQCGLNPQFVRNAFIKLAKDLCDKMSPAEREAFMQKNFPD